MFPGSTTRRDLDGSGSLRGTHLERRAVDDPQHERIEPIVAPRRAAYDGTDTRRVVVLGPATDSIREQPFGHRADELTWLAHQRRQQARHTVEFRAVRQ